MGGWRDTGKWRDTGGRLAARGGHLHVFEKLLFAHSTAHPHDDVEEEDDDEECSHHRVPEAALCAFHSTSTRRCRGGRRRRRMFTSPCSFGSSRGTRPVRLYICLKCHFLKK